MYSNPGATVSASVGHVGQRRDARRGVVVASARSLPLLTCGSASTSVIIMVCDFAGEQRLRGGAEPL